MHSILLGANRNILSIILNAISVHDRFNKTYMDTWIGIEANKRIDERLLAINKMFITAVDQFIKLKDGIATDSRVTPDQHLDVELVQNANLISDISNRLAAFIEDRRCLNH